MAPVNPRVDTSNGNTIGVTPGVGSLSPDAYPTIAKTTLKLAAIRQIRAQLGRSEL